MDIIHSDFLDRILHLHNKMGIYLLRFTFLAWKCLSWFVFLHSTRIAQHLPLSCTTWQYSSSHCRFIWTVSLHWEREGRGQPHFVALSNLRWSPSRVKQHHLWGRNYAAFTAQPGGSVQAQVFCASLYSETPKCTQWDTCAQSQVKLAKDSSQIRLFHRKQFDTSRSKKHGCKC